MTKVYQPSDIEVTVQGRKVKPCIGYHVKQPLRMTSADWQEILCYEEVILDPDGWDRSNYDYSFNKELISEKEFMVRLGNSTTMEIGDL